MLPIKPGSRPPRKRWCEWLQEVLSWTPEQREVAHHKAQEAWQSGSTQAQYAALSEMKVLADIANGSFIHGTHCAVKHRTTEAL